MQMKRALWAHEARLRRMKNEGVRAVHAHFEGVAAQRNAECGIRNSEFRTEAMECVLGSPVL